MTKGEGYWRSVTRRGQEILDKYKDSEHVIVPRWLLEDMIYRMEFDRHTLQQEIAQ